MRSLSGVGDRVVASDQKTVIFSTVNTSQSGLFCAQADRCVTLISQFAITAFIILRIFSLIFSVLLQPNPAIPTIQLSVVTSAERRVFQIDLSGPCLDNLGNQNVFSRQTYYELLNGYKRVGIDIEK